MYNRYIPDGARYAPVSEETPCMSPADHPPQRGPGGNGQGPRQGQGGGGERDRRSRPAGGLTGALDRLGNGTPLAGLGQALGGLLKGFHLEELDTGDILLALIVLLLILEDGDDLDLIITLGLMILLSLGEE